MKRLNTARSKVLLAKIVTWCAGLGVCASLAWGLWSGSAGANPAEWLQNKTGWQALAWLLATLLATPISKLDLGPAGKLGWLVGARRVLGLWSFAFASAHLGVFLLDAGLEWGEIWRDVVKRPFVAAGFAAWCALLPLAATSNGRAMRALGRSWKRLHRLAYAAAALGMLHWYWMRAPKNKLEEWTVFAALFGAWALWRLAIAWRSSSAKKRAAAARDA